MEVYPIEITPKQFELKVKSWLDRAGYGLKDFQVTHREHIEGRSGEYEIDAVARLQIFGGAEIKVLVECKRHKNPIKRDVVMVLNQKLQETGAHKGMIFSTSGFQSGALEFATEHGIALITVQEGKTNYETRDYGQGKAEPPPWVHISDYIGWVTKLNEKGNKSRSVINDDRIDPLRDWLFDQDEK